MMSVCGAASSLQLTGGPVPAQLPERGELLPQRGSLTWELKSLNVVFKFSSTALGV